MTSDHFRRVLRARLAYAERGYQTVPLHVPVPGGCSCRRGAECPSPGKHPRVKWKEEGGTTDPDVIREQCRRWPRQNVAILTGAERSGLLVLDVDTRHGGEATLDALEAEHGVLPQTLSARTGGGGWHLVFVHPGGVVRNDAGRRLGPGLDVRADGGLFVVESSVHASGGRYRWVDWSVPPAPAPAWLLERLRPPEAPRPASVPVRRHEGTSRYVHVALVAEAERVRTAVEGYRNATLNRAAFTLGQLVGAGLLYPSVVEAVLLEAGVATGLAEAEVRGAVASGLRDGQAQPREVA